MRVEFWTIDKLSGRKEKKEVVLQNKIGFDLVDNVSIIGFECFGQMIVDLIPSHKSKR